VGVWCPSTGESHRFECPGACCCCCPSSGTHESALDLHLRLFLLHPLPQRHLKGLQVERLVHLQGARGRVNGRRGKREQAAWTVRADGWVRDQLARNGGSLCRSDCAVCLGHTHRLLVLHPRHAGSGVVHPAAAALPFSESRAGRVVLLCTTRSRKGVGLGWVSIQTVRRPLPPRARAIAAASFSREAASCRVAYRRLIPALQQCATCGIGLLFGPGRAWPLRLPRAHPDRCRRTLYRLAGRRHIGLGHPSPGNRCRVESDTPSKQLVVSATTCRCPIRAALRRHVLVHVVAIEVLSLLIFVLAQAPSTAAGWRICVVSIRGCSFIVLAASSPPRYGWLTVGLQTSGVAKRARDTLSPSTAACETFGSKEANDRGLPFQIRAVEPVLQKSNLSFSRDAR
jgi:hypothetical protein